MTLGSNTSHSLVFLGNSLADDLQVDLGSAGNRFRTLHAEDVVLTGSANIARDIKILDEARSEAFRLIEEDPALSLTEHSATKMVLKERWKGRLELASIG